MLWRKAAWTEARRTLEQLVAIYGRDNVYVELQRHYNRAQESRNQAAIELARSLKLPLLATQGAQYAKPEARQILDVFTCIRHHRHLDTAGRLLSRNSERHIKSPQEMLRLFADLPEATANTLELSSRLGFTLNDLGYKFPSYPVPQGETMSSFLRAAHVGGSTRALPASRTKRAVAAGAAADRTRTDAHRAARTRRIFPDRLGHRALLPRAGHPGAGTRLGGQQRRLLFAGDHGRRSRRNGVAVRALPVGRARRVARHRSRPSQRRPARAGDSVRV